MAKIYIKSEHLQLAEPLMQKYYDYDSSMLIDEIQRHVENSGINYMKKIDGILTVDYDETFKEHKDLMFAVTTPCKEEIHQHFSNHFIMQDDEEEETITDGDNTKYTAKKIKDFFIVNENVWVNRQRGYLLISKR